MIFVSFHMTVDSKFQPNVLSFDDPYLNGEVRLCLREYTKEVLTVLRDIGFNNTIASFAKDGYIRHFTQKVAVDEDMCVILCAQQSPILHVFKQSFQQ